MILREGGRLDIGDYGDSQVIARKDCRPRTVMEADQVIVGLNRTRVDYNQRIRKLRGIDSLLPVVGDRLVCLKNDREKKLLNGGLFNVARRGKEKGGHIPMLVKAEDAAPEAKPTSISVLEDYFLGDEKNIEWELARESDAFTYGYALTAHKSQGSQWDEIVVFDEGHAFKEDARRWRYTAVTRAAEKVTYVI